MKHIVTYFVLLIAVGTIASCKKTITTPVVPPGTDSLKVGLIAHYSLNNSGVDSSGNNHNANIYNGVVATTDRFNKANSALLFDGTTGYMIVNDSYDLRLNNTNFTLNMWVNLEAYNSSYGTEFLCKRGTGSNAGWNYGITGALDANNGYTVGVTSFQVSGGTDPLALGSKVITLNQWHMLTTEYNLQKKQITYYIDGTFDQVINNIPSPSITTTADLYIGQDSQSSGNTLYFIKGKLDDIRIYNWALPTAQLQKLYTLTY